MENEIFSIFFDLNQESVRSLIAFPKEKLRPDGSIKSNVSEE